MRIRVVSLLHTFAALSMSASAAAQQHTFIGGSPGDRFGEAVDGLGDVNGDGFGDLVIGAPHDFEISCSGYPGSYVRVFSGQTGALLYSIIDDVHDHKGSIVRGIGDANGDGRGDLLIANRPDLCCATTPPGASLRSGPTGVQLHFFHVGSWYESSGQSMDGAGDVNADGRADVILGAPEEDTPTFLAGKVFVYSGKDGALLWSFTLGVMHMQLGRGVAGVGDWNGDGRDDVAISTASSWTRVYSVLDQALLFETPHVGIQLDDPGDFDGDGTRDLLVSGSQARVISGFDGSTILQVGGWSRYRMGKDYDGDGRRDLLVSDPLPTGGHAAILSGMDGSTLLDLHQGAPGDFAGWSIADAEDVNADGVSDVIIGSLREEGDRGAAHVYTGFCPPAPFNYCIGAPNSAGPGASLGFIGSWSISAGHMQLVASGCPPNHHGLFYYGPNAIQIPFGNGFRCVGGTVFRLDPPVSTGTSGVAIKALDFTQPPLGSGPGAVSPGTLVRMQFWYRDIPAGMSGFNLSNGLEVVFCR